MVLKTHKGNATVALNASDHDVKGNALLNQKSMNTKLAIESNPIIRGASDTNNMFGI